MIKLIKNLFKIAKLLSVDDSGDFQYATVSFLGKPSQKVLMLKPYGLLSNPPVSSMVSLWSQQGQESNGIGIADDPKNRTLTDMEPGEVGLSNYITEDYIHFDEDGNFIKSITTDEAVTIGGDKGVVITGSETKTVGGTDTETAIGTRTITAPSIILNGNVTINGTLTSNSGAGAITLVSSTLTHNAVNVGDDHIHSQGNDSDGDSEVDTGGPHS